MPTAATSAQQRRVARGAVEQPAVERSVVESSDVDDGDVSCSDGRRRSAALAGGGAMEGIDCDCWVI